MFKIIHKTTTSNLQKMKKCLCSADFSCNGETWFCSCCKKKIAYTENSLYNLFKKQKRRTA